MGVRFLLCLEDDLGVLLDRLLRLEDDSGVLAVVLDRDVVFVGDVVAVLAIEVPCTTGDNVQGRPAISTVCDDDVVATVGDCDAMEDMPMALLLLDPRGRVAAINSRISSSLLLCLIIRRDSLVVLLLSTFLSFLFRLQRTVVSNSSHAFPVCNEL